MAICARGDGCRLAKVDAHTGVEEVLAVEEGADGGGRVDCEEGEDDAAEGAQRGECVQAAFRDVGFYEGAQVGEGCGGEDCGVLEILEKDRVRGWVESAESDCGILTVTMRVFDGGDGWTRGGRSVRSRERFGERRPFEEEWLDVREMGGVCICSEAMIQLVVKLQDTETNISKLLL